MYRGRLWTMRQFAGFGTAAETNERFRYLLEHGQTGLSTAFDMPTLMGYDSDHARSLGEVGREGVAVDSLDDMETLFDGIPLGDVSTSMTINAPAAMLLAFYACVGEKQGVPIGELRGTVQTDILKEYIAQKEWIFPPQPSMRLVVDMIEWCSREMPLMHPVSISGYHIREAGSTAAQELAFTLADGFAYVDACVERGLDVDDFAPRLSFFFNAHLDFFEEIAKYRAARRIWATQLRERYGAKNPRSWLMRFHTQTAGVSLTAQQPEVNLIRTAIEALAAVLGGTQSLHTNSFDEALALPTENAVRLALRTQQVIAHEIGAVNTIDPLGGSYYVEHLTNELERQAYDYFDRIEKLGGVIPAIEENFMQREIAEASYRYQSEVEAKQRVIVGVNRYELEDEVPIEILRIDPALEQQQIERVRALRARRDSAAVEQALAELKRGRRRRHEPDGADHGRLARLRDDGRDVRRASGRLGRLARDAGLLDRSSDERDGPVADDAVQLDAGGRQEPAVLLLSTFAAADAGEHEDVERLRPLRLVAGVHEALEDDELRRRAHRGAARLHDAERIVVVPVVQHVREEVDVAAFRDPLEEAPALDLAPVSDAGCGDRRATVGRRLFEIEEEAPKMRLLQEERQEDPAHAAAHVYDRADVSPVEQKQRVDERRRASLHRAVEDLRLLGIVGEDLPVRPALLHHRDGQARSQAVHEVDEAGHPAAAVHQRHVSR